MTHVALDRRFIAWRKEEGSAIQRLKDPRLYADDIDWKELQKRHRVVILAEAGSGKTEELRAQAQALASQVSFAFYTTVQNTGIEGFAHRIALGRREARHRHTPFCGDAPQRPCGREAAGMRFVLIS